jgi:hypothetical protein
MPDKTADPTLATRNFFIAFSPPPLLDLSEPIVALATAEMPL